MSPWEWVVSLSPHELDVLRTISVVIGTACVPVFGFILTWINRGIKRMTAQTVEQTRRTEYVDGKLHTVSVAEDTHRATHETKDLRSELVGLLGPAVHGRRRLPTGTVRLPPTESNYIAKDTDRE